MKQKQRRVRVILGSNFSPAHPNSLNPPPAAEGTATPSLGCPKPITKPARASSGSCRHWLEQHWSNISITRHRPSPEGGSAPPTCLVCRDVGDRSSPGLQAEVGDAVDGLHPEGVVGVCQEVGDSQSSVHQAHLLGHKADAAATGLARPRVARAAPAAHVVHDIRTAPLVQGRAPLQGHRGAVHTGNQVHGSRGGPWKRSGDSVLERWKWWRVGRMGTRLGQQERSAQTQNWPEQRTAKTRAGIGVKCLAGKMVCIGMANGRQQELVLVLGEAGGFGRRATLDVLTQMEGQTHISLAE